MTRKENLALEVARLEHEVKVLNGKTELAFDADKFYGSHGFYSLMKMSIPQLDDRISHLTKYIEVTKHNKEVADRTEAYYSTQEGQSRKAELLAAKDSIFVEHKKEEEFYMTTLTDLVHAVMGAGWCVSRFWASGCEVAQLGSNGKPIQFNRVEFFYSELNNEGDFKINIGSTGSFEFGSERAEFYKGVGILLGSKKLVDEFRKSVIAFDEFQSLNSDRLDEINELLKNPLNL